MCSQGTDWDPVQFRTALVQIGVPNCTGTDWNSKLSRDRLKSFFHFVDSNLYLDNLESCEGSLIPMMDSEASFPLRIPFCPRTDWNPDFIKWSVCGTLLNTSLILNT